MAPEQAAEGIGCKKFALRVSEETMLTIKCKSCGRVVEVGESVMPVYCPLCGGRLAGGEGGDAADETLSPGRASAQVRKEAFPMMPAAIIGGVLLLLAIVIISLWFSTNSDRITAEDLRRAEEWEQMSLRRDAQRILMKANR